MILYSVTRIMKRVKIGYKTAKTISWILFNMGCDGNLDYPPYQNAADSLDRAIAKVEAKAGLVKEVVIE